jgi:hypothetical protein
MMEDGRGLSVWTKNTGKGKSDGQRAEDWPAGHGAAMDARWAKPVLRPLPQPTRRVFQKADQSMPRCCFCSFLHRDVPRRARVISHRLPMYSVQRWAIEFEAGWWPWSKGSRDARRAAG